MYTRWGRSKRSYSSSWDGSSGRMQLRGRCEAGEGWGLLGYVLREGTRAASREAGRGWGAEGSCRFQMLDQPLRPAAAPCGTSQRRSGLLLDFDRTQAGSDKREQEPTGRDKGLCSSRKTTTAVTFDRQSGLLRAFSVPLKQVETRSVDCLSGRQISADRYLLRNDSNKGEQGSVSVSSGEQWAALRRSQLPQGGVFCLTRTARPSASNSKASGGIEFEIREGSSGVMDL